MEFINDLDDGLLEILFPQGFPTNGSTDPIEGDFVSPFKESPFGENWEKKNNNQEVQNKKLSHG